MPLSINVGLSRKASRDYQSSGISINVGAELDQALLAKPEELQKTVGDLYAQAQDALERQASNMTTPDRNDGHPDDRPTTRSYRDDRDPSRGRQTNGRSNGRRNGGNGNGGRMTDSQRRAILAIADRIRTDARAECRDIMGDDLDDLTLRQASEFIDHLKGLSPAGNGHDR